MIKKVAENFTPVIMLCAKEKLSKGVIYIHTRAYLKNQKYPGQNSLAEVFFQKMKIITRDRPELQHLRLF